MWRCGGVRMWMALGCEGVRVWRVCVNSGVKTSMHNHCRPTVQLYLMDLTG